MEKSVIASELTSVQHLHRKGQENLTDRKKNKMR